MSSDRVTRLPVRLLGGPFDGQQVDADPARQLLTLDWEDETYETDWDGVVVYATRVGLATYQRAGDDLFVYCRTPTAAGATDLDFSEKGDLP